MQTPALILGILLLFAFEIMKVYFIMPFPGSQQTDSVGIAYFLHSYIIYIRLILLVAIAYPTVMLLLHGKWWKRVLLIIALGLYGVVFYMFNFKFLADKMFYQPHHKEFANYLQNRVPVHQLAMAVSVNGQVHAYPIEMMAYHHQVQDTVGGEPIMATYCSVCRTASVFSPIVNGKHETFRLVGMDHFNAMFEDATTKSWWRQVSGECIAGPLKGMKLKQLPSEQMNIMALTRQYRDVLILQPDTDFTKKYAGLEGYGAGLMHGGLEGTDTVSWQPKSWVVGIAYNGAAKAYDWKTLVKKRFIEDSINGLPVLLILENDNESFHVYNRTVNGRAAHFTAADSGDIQHAIKLGIEESGPRFRSLYKYEGDLMLKDDVTLSVWNVEGQCYEGTMYWKGGLAKVQASQEFWHSWKTFHPNTLQYK